MIIIIDFGSQYTQLIARRIREIGVYSEVLPYTVKAEAIMAKNPRGIILSGGPDRVDDAKAPTLPEGLLDLDLPILGICYGMQLLAYALGGEVAFGERREFGLAMLQSVADDPLINALTIPTDTPVPVWMSHGDNVLSVPKGFIKSALSDHCPVAAMYNPDRNWYGVQFHPEVTHTPRGNHLLETFAVHICVCPQDWTPKHMLQEALDSVEAMVKPDEEVILGLSGGVDSAVAAVLIGRVLGKRLHCVFVDHGLMRLGETEAVKSLFSKHYQLDVVYVDARTRFLDALKGVSDPEAKRKIIGKEFITVFEEVSRDYPKVAFLGQGTIYPDVIESSHASDASKNIKSHHNVGGLPETMKLRLLEPLRRFFKDEVRNLGKLLGLPDTILFRHPFPGPALGVRILGEVTQEAIHILQKADAVFLEVLTRQGYYHKVSQAFAVFLPVKSVGVVGDARQYSYVIALRAVETIDFMTAQWAELPHALLREAATRILNEVPMVSRVTYDISDKPPATIEWE